MVKKLLIILGSLAISCIIISGGYGIWQDDLEIEGKIKIKNQITNITPANTDGIYAGNSNKGIQNEMNNVNLNYIYLSDGNSAYSYVVNERIDLNYTGILGNDGQVGSVQDGNNTINQDTDNYIYELDENESMNTFEMNEANNQQEYEYKEGSDMNYVYKSAGN